MTDIIEVANEVCKQINPKSVSPLNSQGDYLTMTPDELQSFADHYRKEGTEEANKTIEELRQQLAAKDEEYKSISKSYVDCHELLAATELVVEQMREALNYAWIPASTPELSMRERIKFIEEALQLQPSLSALREHEAKVLEVCKYRIENHTFMSTDSAGIMQQVLKFIAYMASELRAKGE